MAIVTLALLAAEWFLLSWYLPMVREGVEAFGAYLSLLAVLVLCASGWIFTSKLDVRVPTSAFLASLAAFLLFVSYLLMVHWR